MECGVIKWHFKLVWKVNVMSWSWCFFSMLSKSTIYQEVPWFKKNNNFGHALIRLVLHLGWVATCAFVNVTKSWLNHKQLSEWGDSFVRKKYLIPNAFRLFFLFPFSLYYRTISWPCTSYSLSHSLSATGFSFIPFMWELGARTLITSCNGAF